jgi:hypothetical protein
MATRNDDNGSRLWRGMRALIFGDDANQRFATRSRKPSTKPRRAARASPATFLRTSGRCFATCFTSATRPPATFASLAATSIAVPSTIAFDGLVKAFAEAEHSRLPVFGESLDEIIGMVHIKDLFAALIDSKPATARSRRSCECRCSFRNRWA